MDQIMKCPACNTEINSGFYFCPNCGKKIKDKLLSTSIAKQIIYFLVSALLPPIGLWWAVKYLRQTDKVSKKIGIAIIIITIIATAVTLKLAIDTMNTVNDSVSKQLNMYQNF